MYYFATEIMYFSVLGKVKELSIKNSHVSRAICTT